MPHIYIQPDTLDAQCHVVEVEDEAWLEQLKRKTETDPDGSVQIIIGNTRHDIWLKFIYFSS